MRNATATVFAICITVIVGCKQQSARSPEHTVPSASPHSTSATQSGGSRPTEAREAPAARDCVRDSRVALRKLRDGKPDLSDLRDVYTHGGVLTFDIRVDPSGSVGDVRLARAVEQ